MLSKILKFLQCYFKELRVISQLSYVLCEKLPNIPQGKYEKAAEKTFVRNETLLTFLSSLQRPSIKYCWRLILQFHCNSRGWVVKWISCWHIIDCVIFLFWTIKRNKARERTVMESKGTTRALGSVPPDTNSGWCWSGTQAEFTQKRTKMEKQNSSSGKRLMSRPKKIWILHLGCCF